MAALGFFISETADAASVAAFAPEHGVDVRVAIKRGIKPRCWRAFRRAKPAYVAGLSEITRKV
jgi:hypothetical protein